MNGLIIVFIGLLVIALIVLMPIGGIWALNTLFGLTIALTLKNWFAMFLLMVFFGSRTNTNYKKSE